MTWLLPGADPAAELVARHFCRGCAPTGRVADVVCVRCGDGPLLAGDLAIDDGQGPPPAPVRGWLSAAGWQLSGPVCPGCCRELGR